MCYRDLWLTRWVYVTMGFAVLALFCPPAAGTSPINQSQPSESSTPLLQLSAISPSAGHTASPPEDWREGNRLRQRMNEARAVLEDLRRFADSAQRAILMGQKLKKIRRENERLKQAIEDGGHHVESWLDENGAKTTRLTKATVANWILTLELKHQASAADDRLNLAHAALAKSEERLASLRKQVDERRSAVHDLRAKSAALAAEIGRTRRQIVLSDQETRRHEDHQSAAESAIRQLRHAVSARLRTLLIEY